MVDIQKGYTFLMHLGNFEGKYTLETTTVKLGLTLVLLCNNVITVRALKILLSREQNYSFIILY